MRAALGAPAHEVAAALLGCSLTRPDEGLRARIVEVEAYEAWEPASHTHRGRTPSNAVMFGPAGRLYTYFTYGMHWCANVVTGPEGEGQAVLLRAASPCSPEDGFRARRGDRVPTRDLLRGPARLAQAFGLDRDAGGLDLLDPGSPVRLEGALGTVPAAAVRTGPRTGVRLAADLPWRAWVADDPAVSPHRRHPRAAPPGQDPVGDAPPLSRRRGAP